MTHSLVYVNGTFHQPQDPVLSALDHGVTVGDGVFETCQLRPDGVFALTRHLARLQRSAAGLGLELPSEQEVRDAVAAVEQRWLQLGAGAGRLRITCTSGSGPLGPSRMPGAGTLIVAAGPAGQAGPARVVLTPWTVNERSAIAGLKTTSYAENVVVLDYAKQRGASEALLANTRGELCEGSMSNVFVEVDGQLLTPPLSSGCLAGVTRELVLEWGAQAGIPIQEITVPIAALQSTPHLALTGSTRGIVPVVDIDGRQLQPGPLTERMGQEYQRRSLMSLDP